MIRARIRVDGRLADGLQGLLGAPMVAAVAVVSEMAGQDTSIGARGPGWRELAGTFSWPDDGSVADGRCQAGSGMARSRARARLNWVPQGQCLGRCKVRRRAERVSRPARAKNRRRRVLVVTICSPKPLRAVQRARLWAIACTASQAPLAANRPDGRWFTARRRT